MPRSARKALDLVLRPLDKLIGRPMRRLGRSLSGSGRMGRSQKRWLMVIKLPFLVFLLPFFLLGKLWRRTSRFFEKYFAKRRLLFFLEGLPAMLCIIASALVIATVLGRPREYKKDVVEHYSQVGKNAFAAKDFETAKICFERSVDAEPDRLEHQYYLALTSLELGDRDRAQAMLDRLAPTDKTGYPDAHLWRARQLMLYPRLPRPIAETIPTHLKKVLQAQPENAEANALIARYYLANGMYDLAEPYIRKGMRVEPALQLELAIIVARKGNVEEAKAHIRDARERLQKLVKDFPDVVKFRRDLAEATKMSGDLLGAIGVLEDANETNPNPIYKVLLSEYFIDGLEALRRRDGKAPIETVVKALDQSLEYNPGNARALQSLVYLARADADPNLKPTLQRMLATGTGAPLVHLLLGVQRWQADDSETARFHLEHAFQLSPQKLEVANNLAWVLAFGRNPDLERALQLSNMVVERDSDPRFRDTHGQILVKMERWRESIADLEAALRAVPDKRRTHRALAAAYAGLKMNDVAEEHRRQADALDAKLGAIRPKADALPAAPADSESLDKKPIEATPPEPAPKTPEPPAPEANANPAQAAP